MRFIVAGLVGFMCGFLQSLLCGIKIGNWDSGTGMLWALIIAVVSVIAAVFLGWWSVVLGAAVLSAVVGISTLVSANRFGQEVECMVPTGLALRL